MWNPVTITALIGAVASAAVAVITAIRTPNQIASRVQSAMYRHVNESHADTTDNFSNRVNPN